MQIIYDMPNGRSEFHSKEIILHNIMPGPKLPADGSEIESHPIDKLRIWRHFHLILKGQGMT